MTHLLRITTPYTTTATTTITHPQWRIPTATCPRPTPPPHAAAATNFDVNTRRQVLDLCQPHGNVIFCQVACHRDSGLSRGYAFVSYETVEEAEKAIAALHNMTVEGRALRVEVARADREASKPY